MVFISIESRKGGVGKTTVSLTMAELLLQKGFQVLLFDMDFIGTRMDPTFLKANQHIIHEVSQNDTPVNLISLFKHWYLGGKGVPAFLPFNVAQKDSLTFERDKCNLIGSNIYDRANKNTPIEDPRILYDAFHAYWMLEFVKKITRAFCDANGTDDNIAIVFDNSPGLSSIENSVNDYLTEIGPKKGKIILVSSVDPQDIEACRQSKRYIENVLDEKKAAGKYYRSLLGEGNGTKSESVVFQSVWNMLCATDGKQPEYYSKDTEEVVPFISILVNKAPRNIYEQLYSKRLLDKEEVAVPFLNHLLYYFSNPLLELQDIRHQLNFKGGLTEFRLSGRVDQIDEDEIRYQGLREYTKQIGLADFFKAEWSPKLPFIELIENLREREELQEVGELSLSYIYNESQEMTRRHPTETEVVEQFVKANLKNDSTLKDKLPLVVKHVNNALQNVSAEAGLNLHSDMLKFQEIEDFVVYYGIAAYRLQTYEMYCNLLNELMGQCLEDVEKMETLDYEAVCNKVQDIIEGRVGNDVLQSVSQLVSAHKNARELVRILDQIIKIWGLAR